MRSADNPYAPGAGTPPPELAGRATVLEQAENVITRSKRGRPAKSIMMLGLRGVGKTVLLNRIDLIAENTGSQTALFEADTERALPELLTPQLHRLLLKLNRLKRVGDEIRKAFGLLRSFASAFKVKFEGIEFGISDETSTGDLTIDLSDLLVAIGQAARLRKTATVILIDEMQYVTKHDLSALMIALHKVSQRQLPLLVMGAGLPQLARLAGDAKSYAERLFDYQEIGRLDPESARLALVKPAELESVRYEDGALHAILEQTDCYPFFLQVWGFHSWEAAAASPITAGHVGEATKVAIADLDKGFFKVRFDRLTDRQRDYVRAMAELGRPPATSAAVADQLGITVNQAAPIRDEVIKKGVAYSPKRGIVAFTVPKFGDFIKRTGA
jgi:hypothetical protein